MSDSHRQGGGACLGGEVGGVPRAAISVVLPASNPTGLPGPAWRRRLDGQVRAASSWAGTVIKNVGTRWAGGGGAPRTFQNKWLPPSENFPPLELGQKVDCPKCPHESKRGHALWASRLFFFFFFLPLL